jgi:hypothetical protein
MTRTEQIVTWGLLGFIAYELYQGSGMGAAGCSPPSSLPSSGESNPQWVGQLAGAVYGQDFTTPACGLFGRCG